MVRSEPRKRDCHRIRLRTGVRHTAGRPPARRGDAIPPGGLVGSDPLARRNAYGDGTHYPPPSNTDSLILYCRVTPVMTRSRSGNALWETRFGELRSLCARIGERCHGWCYRWLMGRSPEAARTLVRGYTRANPLFTDADPFKIVDIDPTSITDYSAKTWPVVWGMVEGGDWDEPSKSFVEEEIPRGVYEYVTTGDATRLRAAIRDRLGRGDRPVWGYSDPDAIDARIEDIDRLIGSIRQRGYRAQTELHHSDSDPEEWSGTYHFPPAVNEVTVTIGRDGTLYYLYCGQHRLAIAQALDIETIPALVATRHREWQAVRDTVRHADGVGEIPSDCRRYENHPDLQDVWPRHSKRAERSNVR